MILRSGLVIGFIIRGVISTGRGVVVVLVLSFVCISMEIWTLIVLMQYSKTI